MSNILKYEQKTKILCSQNTAYYGGFHISGPLNNNKKKKNT